MYRDLENFSRHERGEVGVDNHCSTRSGIICSGGTAASHRHPALEPQYSSHKDFSFTARPPMGTRKFARMSQVTRRSLLGIATTSTMAEAVHESPVDSIANRHFVDFLRGRRLAADD